MFKNCANWHNSLADWTLKEEPKQYLLNMITLTHTTPFFQTTKQNKTKNKQFEGATFRHCVGMLAYPDSVTVSNKKAEFDLRILYCRRGMHEVRAYLKLNKKEPRCYLCVYICTEETDLGGGTSYQVISFGTSGE